MRPRAASHLAWSLFGLVIAMLALTAVSLLVEPIPQDEVVFAFILPVLVLAFGWIGALIASRQRRNAIGWIFLAVAVLWGTSGAGGAVAQYAASHDLTSSTIARVSDWVASWIFLPGIFLPVTYLLLLFPDGRAPSRRWRVAGWGAAVALVGITVSGMFRPGPIEDVVFLDTNPYAVGSAAFWDALSTTVWWLAVVSMIASVAAVVVRLRRARGDERQQLRWLAFTAVFVASTFLVLINVQSIWGASFEIAAQALILITTTLIPVATGLAILKHRLYDIDLVIRKTVLYGTLAAFVTLIYVGIVVGIGALVGSRGNLLLSIVATALIAVAFQPARDRVRRMADRLVYGRRASPYEILSTFSDRLAEAYSIDDVVPRMARVLAEGTGASIVRVWLRVGDELRPVATWPEDAPTAAPTRDLSDLPDRPFEVRHQGEPLGAITVAMPAAEPMTPTQETLVQDVAAQAGLVLRNAALVADLRASRQRLVTAQDQERRRIERNIHDGAQQQLVALSVKLGLVERLIQRDPQRAASMLAEAKSETGEALDDLRDLARGIYPPLLADQGLAAALEAQARRSPIRVSVEPDGIGRYRPEIEAAVYFCSLEALQNVAKYADATTASIRLAQANDELSFEVTDDGSGFDVEATSYGTGLQGMADRLAALGGTLRVRSTPGRGSTVTGSLPVGEA